MRKLVFGVSVGLVLAVAGGVCLELHRVGTRLTVLRREISAARHLPYTLRRLDTSASATSVLFEPIESTSTFTAGEVFAGKLYLAGPGGLAIYPQDTLLPAAPLAFLRTGIELPPAPIVALATGHLRGEASPVLIAATRGEGLLLITPGSPGSVRQLLPGIAAERDITSALALSSGDLLLGTRRSGLLLYDGSMLRTFHAALAADAITALAGDDGDLWIGTRTHGLKRWHAGELSSLTQQNGLPDAQINALAFALSGKLYAGTPLGTAELLDGKVTHVLASGLFANALAVDGGTLHIATLDQGIHDVSLNSRSAHAISIADRGVSLNSEPSALSFFTSGGTLYAVNERTLLARERGTGWSVVIDAPQGALADRNISALALSTGKRLWIGYFDRGLDMLDLTSNRAQHLEDDHLFCINRIVADPQRGTMDVATANGLVLLDDRVRERQVLTRRDGLISDQITDVAFTRSGMALATPAGLTFFTTAGAQSLYAFQGLVNNHVYALAAQPMNEHLLAGTLGGISVLENQAVQRNLTLRNSKLRRNWITAFVQIPGHAQGWLVGTYGGGVMQIDAAGNISAMQSPAPDAVINPNALLATSQHIFAGSLNDGLLVYNIATQHWTKMTAGLPSRNVTAFAYGDDTLYVGTDNGIVRLTEARLP